MARPSVEIRSAFGREREPDGLMVALRAVDRGDQFDSFSSGDSVNKRFAAVRDRIHSTASDV